MLIKEIAKKGLQLSKIEAEGFLGDVTCSRFERLHFHFENKSRISIGVDVDTDELCWIEGISNISEPTDLSEIIPVIIQAYGLRVFFIWEMLNHQGYFDAIQIELSSQDLKKTIVLQFKVEASAIRVFNVNLLECAWCEKVATS